MKTLKKIVEELTDASREDRRTIICSEASKSGYNNPIIQPFNSKGHTGENIIFEGGFCRKGKRLVVSAHYDGPGAYDNAGGVAVLIGLMRKTKTIEGITYAFFDCEETGQLGSKAYLRTFEKDGYEIVQDITVDGCGIGNTLVDISKMRKGTLRYEGKEIDYEVKSDSDTFRKNGIPSAHYATLPKDELRKLRRSRTFPKTWLRVHRDDTIKGISEKSLQETVNHLCKNILHLGGK